MTFRISAVMLAVALLPIANTNTAGQEPLTPEAPWIAAKKTYLETHEKLRQTVINHLDASETKARERGDLAKLKEVKAEREAFDDQGQFPATFDRSAYNRSLKAAQEDLKKAEKALLTHLLKAKRDTEAEELEKELLELLDNSTARARTTAKAPSTAPDSRVRWVNTSYNSTIYHVKDKQWAEIKDNADKPIWYLQETARGPDYIEVFLPDRQQTWRIFDKRVEFKKDGKWEWLSNGYWVHQSGQPLETKPKALSPRANKQERPLSNSRHSI